MRVIVIVSNFPSLLAATWSRAPRKIDDLEGQKGQSPSIET
jgi:hypothetical protein